MPVRFVHPETGVPLVIFEIGPDGYTQASFTHRETGVPVAEICTTPNGAQISVCNRDSKPLARMAVTHSGEGGVVNVYSATGDGGAAMIADEMGGEVEVMGADGRLGAALTTTPETGDGELLLQDAAGIRSTQTRGDLLSAPEEPVSKPAAKPARWRPASRNTSEPAPLPAVPLMRLLAQVSQFGDERPPLYRPELQQWVTWLHYDATSTAQMIRDEIKRVTGRIPEHPGDVANAVLLCHYGGTGGLRHGGPGQPHYLEFEEGNRAVLFAQCDKLDETPLDLLEALGWGLLANAECCGSHPVIIGAAARQAFDELLHEIVAPAVKVFRDTLILGTAEAAA